MQLRVNLNTEETQVVAAVQFVCNSGHQGEKTKAFHLARSL